MAQAPSSRDRAKFEDWLGNCNGQVLGDSIMPLVSLVSALIVVGVALWLTNRFIPMASGMKTILNAVVAVAVWIWVLQTVGMWKNLSSW